MQITIIHTWRWPVKTMLAVDNYPGLSVEATLPKQELLEIHRSKISLHRAKAGYDYPTIRLPHTFLNLPAYPHESIRLYTTDHWPFSQWYHAQENASKTPKSSVLTWRRTPVRIRPVPSFFFQLDGLYMTDKALSAARIATETRAEPSENVKIS